MRTTLVMLVNQLRNSGPNRVMLDIARNIDRQRIAPVVISLMPDGQVRPIADSFLEEGIEIKRFNYSKLELELKTKSIARIIEEYISNHFMNPVVQAHGYHPTLLAAHMHLPHTATIHCIASEDFIASKGRLLGTYMVHRFKHNLKKYSWPVAISEYMVRYYFKACGEKLQLIHNGVNFTPWEGSVDNLRNKLAIPFDTRLIVIPGGLHKRKNNLHTIAQLKKCNNSKFLCIFLGLGDQEDELKAAVAEDSRFRFDGYKPNVKEYLACADLYISSSFSEGLPLAALEALCMGVPSLLSDIPPHNEIASLMGIGGVENFSLNDDSLAEKLDKYLFCDFDRHGISNRALEKFSGATMGAKYSELIARISNE